MSKPLKPLKKPLKPLNYYNVRDPYFNNQHQQNDFSDYLGKKHEDLFANLLTEHGLYYNKDEISLNKPENRSQLYDFLVEHIKIDVKTVSYNGTNPCAKVKVSQNLKHDFYTFYWVLQKKFVYATRDEVLRWGIQDFGNYNAPAYYEELSKLHPIDELIEILLKSKKMREHYENYGIPDAQIRDMIRCKLMLKNT